MRRIKNIPLCAVCLLVLVFLTFTSAAEDKTPGKITETGKNSSGREAEVSAEDSKITVKDNLLSVDLSDAEFADVIQSIGRQSGFEVEIYSDFSGGKVTTKFDNIDIERGISRLLMLIREKNYLFRYDAKGMLSRIEIYGSIAPSAPVSRLPQPSRIRNKRPVYRRPATVRSQTIQRRPNIISPKPPVSPRTRSLTPPSQPGVTHVVPLQEPKIGTKDKNKKVEKEIIRESDQKESGGEVKPSPGEEINKVETTPYTTSEKMQKYNKHMVLPPKNR